MEGRWENRRHSRDSAGKAEMRWEGAFIIVNRFLIYLTSREKHESNSGSLCQDFYFSTFMIIIYYESSIKIALKELLNMKNLISHYPHTKPFQWPPGLSPRKPWVLNIPPKHLNAQDSPLSTAPLSSSLSTTPVPRLWMKPGWRIKTPCPTCPLPSLPYPDLSGSENQKNLRAHSPPPLHSKCMLADPLVSPVWVSNANRF